MRVQIRLQDCGGEASSESKRYESCPGNFTREGLIDLIRAAIVDRPLEHIQMPMYCSTGACSLIPRAALTPEPLEYLQLTMLSCTRECPLIPGATLDPEPPQYLKVTSTCCEIAHILIPTAALAPEPLQYLQVTTSRCIHACISIPGAALAPEPLQYLQTAILAGILKEFRIQLKPLLGFQPLQGLQLVSLRCEEEKEVKSRNKQGRRD